MGPCTADLSLPAEECVLNCKITSAAVQKKEEAELAMSFDLAAMLVVKLKSGVSLQKRYGNIFHIYLPV